MGKRRALRLDEEIPPRAFAPALAIKKPKTEYGQHEGLEFKWMVDDSFQQDSFWNTMDPSTNKRTWSSASQILDNFDPTKTMWDKISDSRASKIKPADTTEAVALDVAPEVVQQFVGSKDIMRPELESKSLFERRNRASIDPVAYGGIVTKFSEGETFLECQYDSRIEAPMDLDGSYIDSRNRGRMKKRFLLERKARLKQREEEILRANALYREWWGLNNEERESRRSKAQRNRGLILEKLELEFEEGIPDVYRIANDFLWKKIRECKRAGRETANENAYKHSNLQSNSLQAYSHQQNDYEEPLFLPSDDDQLSTITHSEACNTWPTVISSKPWESGKTGTSKSRHSSRSHSRDHSSPKTSYTPWPNQRRWKEQPLYTGSCQVHNTQKLHEDKLALVRSTAAPSVITDVCTFTFKNWPELIPLEDIEHAKEIEFNDHLAKYELLENICQERSRLVVLELAKEVEFTGAAVNDRVFGGAVQEIQYFPDDKQALIAFLSPLDAKSYLDHVKSCRNFSALEYRRLQVHASYYKGKDDTGTWPVQAGTLTSVIIHQATRVLKVDNIPKVLKKSELLLIMKGAFMSKHLVRVKLIVPWKNYEREGAYSNSAILEFASIKQAIEAKESFNSKNVRGFEGSSAQYLSDPCSIEPTRMPFCDCLSCKQGPNICWDDGKVLNLDLSAEISTRSRHPQGSAPSDKALQMLKEVREMQSGGVIFSSEKNAKPPKEWDERPLRWRTREWDLGDIHE